MERTLQSWKEIAGYLGRGVRTAQRWEELGLPIRRPQPYSRKSAVYAITHELDAWLLSNSVEPHPMQADVRGAQHIFNERKGSGGLQQVLITRELSARPLGKRDGAAQIRALEAVGREITKPADQLLGIVVNHALELCVAGSAGLSVLHEEDEGQKFHWDVLAGVLRDHVGETTPRDFSPCGVTLDRKSPQLFSYPARYFRYFEECSVPLVEGLVIPIFVDEKPLGTLWIISHTKDCQFNSEDVLVMTGLAAFCQMALSYLAHARSQPISLKDCKKPVKLLAV
jgi:hypothetical protein